MEPEDDSDNVRSLFSMLLHITKSQYQERYLVRPVFETLHYPHLSRIG